MNESKKSEIELPADVMQSLDCCEQFAEIDSTNAEALRQLQAGKKGTFLLLAQTQTAGRGRRGKLWLSPPKAGIYMSLVRPFTLQANELQALSLVTALAVQEGLSEYGANGIQLKWPNDLLVNKKKLGGILLEFKQSEEVNYIVFGIGINLSLPHSIREEIGQPATDLEEVLNATVDKSEVLAHILRVLFTSLSQFELHSFSSFQEKWNLLDCYRNQDIVLQTGDQHKIGRSLGVDAKGALLLQTGAGLEVINGGEIFPTLREATREALR